MSWGMSKLSPPTGPPTSVAQPAAVSQSHHLAASRMHSKRHLVIVEIGELLLCHRPRRLDHAPAALEGDRNLRRGLRTILRHLIVVYVLPIGLIDPAVLIKRRRPSRVTVTSVGVLERKAPDGRRCCLFLDTTEAQRALRRSSCGASCKGCQTAGPQRIILTRPDRRQFPARDRGFVWSRWRLHASGEFRAVSAELLHKQPYYSNRASVGVAVCDGTDAPADGVVDSPGFKVFIMLLG